jgi:hypothetical protein
MTTPSLAEEIELHRDRMWRRDEELSDPLPKIFDTTYCFRLLFVTDPLTARVGG